MICSMSRAITHDLSSREGQCPNYLCLNVLIQPHLSEVGGNPGALLPVHRWGN